MQCDIYGVDGIESVQYQVYQGKVGDACVLAQGVVCVAIVQGVVCGYGTMASWHMGLYVRAPTNINF